MRPGMAALKQRGQPRVDRASVQTQKKPRRAFFVWGRDQLLLIGRRTGVRAGGTAAWGGVGVVTTGVVAGGVPPPLRLRSTL